MRATTLITAAAIAIAVLFFVRMGHTEDEGEGAGAPVQAADHLGTERHVLVIGINDYADRDFKDLTTRENDARGVLAVLLDLDAGGVPEANAIALIGAEATAAQIRAALVTLHRLPKEATVFVYFAGHAATKGEDAYLAARDSEADDLPGTAIAAAEVQKLLGQIPAERVLLMMDCTHAPGLVGKQGTRVDHAEVLARYFGAKYATVAAAAAKEHTIEADGVKRSVFTQYLIEGLSGKADTDEDGIVVLSELAPYVNRRVGAETLDRRGLERPVSDFAGVPDASRLFLTIEREGLAERLLDEEPAQTRRRERLAALEALHGEDRISKEHARLGRHLLGTLPEGFETYETEQRTLFIDLAEGRLASEHFAGALAAIRRADRKTFVVPDEFETIQAAIDAARAGDTVFVKAGVYAEHVVFKNGLFLKGEGSERTLIRMAPAEDGVPSPTEILLAQDCSWGRIEGLQLDGTGGRKTGDWSPDGIHLNRASVRISDCLAYRCLGGGVYASGPGCRPYIRDCTFEQNTQDGLCVSEVESALIIDCICRSNGAVGVQARKSSRAVEIRNCLCELNKHAGIGVSGGATATVAGNDCQRNGGQGIIAWDAGTSVTLEDNNCSKNEVCGVYVVQGAKAVANRNVCQRNRSCGFAVSGAGTRATLVGNRCLDHAFSDNADLSGILFLDGAGGEATSNLCAGNVCGILVKGPGTSAHLRDNTCRKNKTSGIAFSDASPGQATGNQCVENQHGIVASNTDVTLEGNTLTRNSVHGILICRGADGKASENRCEENVKIGIQVTDPGTRAELLRNTCVSNGSHGIQFARRAAGTADGNECKGNKVFGISALNSGTRPTFRRNRCTDNGRAGIGKEKGAAPIIEGSNVQSGNGG